MESRWARSQLKSAKAAAVGKNLDIVLKTAQTEHQNVSYVTWATQNSKLHTYLWLAVAIISAEMALLMRIVDENSPDSAGLISLFFLAVAVLTSLGAFAVGIDCMRSRTDIKRPIYGDYNYNVSVAEYDASGLRTRREMISALENSIYEQIEEVSRVGKKLRILSVFNLVSVLIGVLAFICYCLPKVRLMLCYS